MTGRPPTLDLGGLRAVSVLGRGAKGVAFLVRLNSSGETLALKAISRSSVEKKSGGGGGGDAYRRIWFERDVLLSLCHPLLPSLRGVVSTDRIVGFAIDWCPGGDLGTLRGRQTEKMFSDEIIRFYAAELVLALEYLHGLGIVYRDLKPHNVLIQENGHLMLVDFDLSARLPARSPDSLLTRSRRSDQPHLSAADPDKNKNSNKKKKRRRIPSFLSCDAGVSPETAEEPAKEAGGAAPPADCSAEGKSNSFVGTEEYVAPEIILGNGHDFAVDWWSLGVVLYEMLYGRTPFRGQNRKETFYRILTKPPELVGEPTALRDLIGKLLEKRPEGRITCAGIKGHVFFRGVDWESVLRVSRPPHIPAGPDWEEEGADDIDVEKFVEGVFGSADVAKQRVSEGTREEGLSADFRVF